MADYLKKKTPPQTWTAWGFLWIIYAMNANIRELLNRISPYIINEYNITATTFGLLQTFALFGLAIGAIPLGSWADKGGTGWIRKKRSFILASVYLTATLLCGFKLIAGAFVVFFALNVIRGLTSGAGEACEVGMMMEWSPKEKSGFFVGLHHTGYPWGTLLGGLIITFYLSTFGDGSWRYTFLIFPIIGYITWAFYYKWAGPDNYKKFQDNASKVGLTTQLGEESIEDFTPPPGLLGRALKNPNISVIVVVAFCCLFCYSGINFWLTPYITFVGNFDPALAASLSVVFTITGGLGQVFWGGFSDRVGSKTALLICTLWLVIAFVLMQFAGVSLTMLIVLQLFMGFALNAVYAMIYKFVAVSSEKGGVVLGNSLIVFGMYFGGGVATFVIGRLIDAAGGWQSASGYYAGLYVMAGVMALAFIITLLFTRETNGPWFKRDFSLVSLRSCNLDKIDDPYATK
ncbi:MAG: MFS transporter [Anaerovoracaceae bacterium]|jgi:MFS family permease